MTIRACVLFALALPTALPGFSVASSAREAPDLGAILEHLSRVAGLYVDEALRFTCDENILSTRYDFNHRPIARQEHDFAYVYVFEETAATARDRLAGLRDFRTKLSEAGVTGETTEVDLACDGRTPERSYSARRGRRATNSASRATIEYWNATPSSSPSQRSLRFGSAPTTGSARHGSTPRATSCSGSRP